MIQIDRNVSDLQAVISADGTQAAHVRFYLVSMDLRKLKLGMVERHSVQENLKLFTRGQLMGFYFAQCLNEVGHGHVAD